VQIWGVVGVISATIIARMSTSFWYMTGKSAEITGLSVYKIFENTFLPFIFPLSGSMLMVFLLNQLDFEGMFKIMLHVIMISLVYIWLVLYVSLDAGSRAKVFNRARYVFKG
jgi:cation transporter-like permease